MRVTAAMEREAWRKPGVRARLQHEVVHEYQALYSINETTELDVAFVERRGSEDVLYLTDPAGRVGMTVLARAAHCVRIDPPAPAKAATR